MNIVSSKELDGVPALTISTGMTPRAFAQTGLSQTLASRGYIVHPSLEIEEWIPEGTWCEESESKEKMLVRGPDFPGTTLLETIKDNDKEAAWAALHQCVSLISRAALENKLSPEIFTLISGMGPEGILHSSDGRILILPPELFMRCLDGHGDTIVRENRFEWIHPDFRTLNPSWSFAFFSGTLAYRIIAGFQPFTQGDKTTAEELARHMRKGVFEPLQMAVWEIRQSAAACINALIASDIATSTDTLLAFGPHYQGLLDPQKEGIGESEAFAEEKEKNRQKIKTALKRERFLRKYRGAFNIALVCTVIAAIFTIMYVNDLKSQPTTKGMNPLSIVSGYYQGIATLDQVLPGVYLNKGVKTPYSDLATNIFVTTKMREIYETNAGILSPAKLFLVGKPGNKTIYGITGLSIEEKKKTDTEAEFQVSLYVWMPVSPDTEKNTETTILLSIYKYRDTVFLEKQKGLWGISKIENIEATLMAGDGNKLIEQIADGSAKNLPYAPNNADFERARQELTK